MRIPVAEVISRGQVDSSRVRAISRVREMIARDPAAISNKDLVHSRETLAVGGPDLLRRVAEAPAASLEAKAVRTPQPRMRGRPPAKR